MKKVILLLNKNKNRLIVCLMLSFVLMVNHFNFDLFLMGSPAKRETLAATIIYFCIWFIFIFGSWKCNNSYLLKMAWIFWLIMVVASCDLFIVNKISDYRYLTNWKPIFNYSGITMPIAVLTFGTFYGIDIFFKKTIHVVYVILLMSWIYFQFSFVLWKHRSKNTNHNKS